MARVVVVTGGSSGIGRAIAQTFARVGDRVVVIARNERALRDTAEQMGERVTWQRADVSCREEVSAAIEAITRVHPRIDVLVNNAGTSGGKTTNTSLEEAERDWDNTVGSNLKGSFLMAFAVAPYLTRPAGRIINISSVAAFTGGSRPGAGAYAAAKAGVLGLTYALARELSPQGITVNAVAPGLIADTAFFGGPLPAERLQHIVAQTPAGRTGQPKDIAAAVLYLASPEAAFVTGEVLHVNGGWLFGR